MITLGTESHKHTMQHEHDGTHAGQNKVNFYQECAKVVLVSKHWLKQKIRRKQSIKTEGLQV